MTRNGHPPKKPVLRAFTGRLAGAPIKAKRGRPRKWENDAQRKRVERAAKLAELNSLSSLSQEHRWNKLLAQAELAVSRGLPGPGGYLIYGGTSTQVEKFHKRDDLPAKPKRPPQQSERVEREGQFAEHQEAGFQQLNWTVSGAHAREIVRRFVLDHIKMPDRYHSTGEPIHGSPIKAEAECSLCGLVMEFVLTTLEEHFTSVHGRDCRRAIRKRKPKAMKNVR